MNCTKICSHLLLYAYLERNTKIIKKEKWQAAHVHACDVIALSAR
jgi:hypothetical protein